MSKDWLEQIKWTADGLVPVIAQDASSGRVLMFAWMSRESLAMSLEKGEAVYWSRSRKELWHKGEKSGYVQRIKEIRLDCDKDVILMLIQQQGDIACHTGRNSCFYHRLENDSWAEVDPVIRDPETIYGET